MADTKISGLVAAAAFTPSTTQEFPINDAGTSHKLSAAQIAAYFPNGTQGSSWYAQVTANQGTFTAQTDLTGLTVTVTLGGSRRIRISGFCLISSSVATDQVIVNMWEGATELTRWTGFVGAANGTLTATPTVILAAPASGSHTYKLGALRVSGTGNITMYAASIYPAFILVEDLGT